MWNVFGSSVRGASHKRKGLPNQDALAWSWAGRERLPLVVALADGHGSAKSFRSEVGARCAVEIASSELLSLASHPADRSMLSDVVPRRIVGEWQQLVQAHAASEPFTVEEREGLLAAAGPAARREVEAEKAVAYGTTLLAAAVNDAHLFLVQLGDGDILFVSDAGEVSRPLPPDERLLGNFTTSLSSADPAGDFRTLCLPLGESAPVLVLLATDGYANSYADDAAFLQVGSDLLRLIRSEGPRWVEDQLAGWLEEVTGRGSGDDITSAVLLRGGDRP